jgi:phytoene dehydrogenase-like protein
MRDKNIIIIGAGISGLIAAIELEKKGYAPIILESSASVGGRVKTDHEGDFRFDHGFQVLLTAYPEAQRYLDYDTLKLKKLQPGAIIHSGEHNYLIADPIRQPAALLAMISSPVGTLMDKWKMWRLTQKLKSKSIEAIFTAPSISTLSYLENLGFSDRILNNFFRPFFGGIFLEDELNTSSRMFQFIFKMFSEGHAAVPADGMQAIPDQLAAQLKKTEIRFNTEVTSISENVIATNRGPINYQKVILTIPPHSILQDYPSEDTTFQGTVNSYFAIPKGESKSYIGLRPVGKRLINNLCVISDISSQYASGDMALLSVSTLGNPISLSEDFTQTLLSELTDILGLQKSDIRFLRHYNITKALPVLEAPNMQLSTHEVKYNDKIYLAGDYLLGGSLNAAMVSGRQSVQIMLDNMVT